MPFKIYWHLRYYESAAAERFRRGDIVLAIFYSISIPGLLILALRIRRRAPLYFDRENGILYSWYNGKARANYYDDLWVYQNVRATSFCFYTLDNNQLKRQFFTLQTSGNPFVNSIEMAEPILAFIAQFMDRGRDAILDHDWEGRRGFFFFEHKKPADFDQQLQKILALIREEKVAERADEQAREWGLLEAVEQTA